MSEHSYTKTLKDLLHTYKWTIINMEILGNGVVDFMIAKNKYCFFIEAKFKKRKLTTTQIVWRMMNRINLNIWELRKNDEGLILTTDDNSYIFKSTRELVEFFERRIK